MKQSNSQIFNNSEKSPNNSLRSINSLIKNSSSTPKNRSKNITCLNFPKLYYKLKYTRNKNNIENKSISSEMRYTSDNNASIRKNKNSNINKGLSIYHYPLMSQRQISTNTRYMLPIIESNKTQNKYTKLNHLNLSLDN